jgi:hypothetical protein
MSICSGFVTYVYQCIFNFAVIDEEATITIFFIAFTIIAFIASPSPTPPILDLLLHTTEH